MDQTSESSFHPMDRMTCSAIERGVSRASGPLYCRVLMIEEWCSSSYLHEAYMNPTHAASHVAFPKSMSLMEFEVGRKYLAERHWRLNSSGYLPLSIV